MTTLVSPDEVPQLEAMAAEMGIELQRLPEPPALEPAAVEGADLEDVKRGLDDIYQLFEAQEPGDGGSEQH